MPKQVGDLQVANITKENKKENLEYQINKKTSQSMITIKEEKSRHWMMDSNTLSQRNRLEKVFYMEEINKPLI